MLEGDTEGDPSSEVPTKATSSKGSGGKAPDNGGDDEPKTSPPEAADDESQSKTPDETAPQPPEQEPEGEASPPDPGALLPPGDSVCGNGQLEADEACDDGNLAEGDSCSSECTIEPGWVWIEQPESQCMNGSSTGIGIRRKPNAKQLVIYMQGGGGCFDTITCRAATARTSFSGEDFEAWQMNAGSRGLFNSEIADNPFTDLSTVFVPYCSGDVFGGQKTISSLTGPFQHFGHLFAESTLAWAREHFPDVEQVILSGSSAGGFGALYNAATARELFPAEVDLLILADSAAIFSTDFVSPCLEERWQASWDLYRNLPPDRTAEETDLGLRGIFPFLARQEEAKAPVRLAVIAGNRDTTLRAFFGVGYSLNGQLTENCLNRGIMPGPQWEGGLCELRDDFTELSDQFYTYYIDSNRHTWLEEDDFVESSAGPNEIGLGEWLEALIADDELPTHIASEGVCGL